VNIWILRPVLLSLLLSCLPLAALADQIVDIGTHCLQVHQEGHGYPVIVIDAGLGNTYEDMMPLVKELSQHTRVLCYNRAGYGDSDPGPLPRHCVREAAELKCLLDSLDIGRPCIFLGHSLGAINVQIYADRYKNDVDGLVLLDPPPRAFIEGGAFPELHAMADSMTREWDAMADSLAESDDPAQNKRASFFRMIASEHREMFGTSADELSYINATAEFPVLVVASAIPNPAFGEQAEAFQKFWIDENRKLSRQSPWGRFMLAQDATHNIPRDTPEIVADGVMEIVHLIGGG